MQKLETTHTFGHSTWLCSFSQQSHCSIAAPGGPSVQGTEMETLKKAIGAAHGCAARRELHIPLQWWKELHGATFVPGRQAWGMVA